MRVLADPTAYGEVVHVLEVVFQETHHGEEVAVSRDQHSSVEAAHLGDHVHGDADVNALFAHLSSLESDVAIIVVVQPVRPERLNYILTDVPELQEIGVLLDFLEDRLAELVESPVFVLVPVLGLLNHQLGGQLGDSAAVLVGDALRAPEIGRPRRDVLGVVPIHPHQLVLPTGNVVKLCQRVLEELLPAEVLLIEAVFRIVRVGRIGAKVEVPQVVPEVLAIHKYYGFEWHVVAPDHTGKSMRSVYCISYRPAKQVVMGMASPVGRAGTSPRRIGKRRWNL